MVSHLLGYVADRVFDHSIVIAGYGWEARIADGHGWVTAKTIKPHDVYAFFGVVPTEYRGHLVIKGKNAGIAFLE